MSNLEKEVELIKERNKRVEKDKAWETSLVRRLSIAVLTYIIVVTYSILIKNVSNVFLTSLVPVIGFLLSTLSINLIRKLWERKKGN